MKPNGAGWHRVLVYGDVGGGDIIGNLGALWSEFERESLTARPEFILMTKENFEEFQNYTRPTAKGAKLKPTFRNVPIFVFDSDGWIDWKGEEETQ